MKRLGHITITYEQLASMLGLPPNHDVVYVIQGPNDQFRRSFAVVIEGRTMPECAPGSMPMQVGL